jgi:hypothetical protein
VRFWLWRFFSVALGPLSAAETGRHNPNEKFLAAYKDFYYAEIILIVPLWEG